MDVKIQSIFFEKSSLYATDITSVDRIPVPFVLLGSQLCKSIDNNTENDVKGDYVDQQEETYIKKYFFEEIDFFVIYTSINQSFPDSSSQSESEIHRTKKATLQGVAGSLGVGNRAIEVCAVELAVKIGETENYDRSESESGDQLVIVNGDRLQDVSRGVRDVHDQYEVERLPVLIRKKAEQTEQDVQQETHHL